MQEVWEVGVTPGRTDPQSAASTYVLTPLMQRCNTASIPHTAVAQHTDNTPKSLGVVVLTPP